MPTLDGRAVPRGDRHRRFETGEMAEALRWSQTVIDLADGDPTKGNIVFGSPLAMALAIARHRPVGAGPCGVARRLTTGRWPWPGGPTRCRMPSSSRTPTVSR